MNESPDYERIRNKVKRYLKANQEGHALKVEEPDIAHAFNMDKRVEKFEIGLEDLTAHTLNIIEIIEEEKNIMELKNHRKRKRKIEEMESGRRP